MIQKNALKQNPNTQPVKKETLIMPRDLPPNIKLSRESFKFTKDFVAALANELNSLSLSGNSNRAKHFLNEESSSSKHVEVINYDSSSEISDTQSLHSSVFRGPDPSDGINNLVKFAPPPMTHHYYHRPTLVVILYEEIPFNQKCNLMDLLFMTRM